MNDLQSILLPGIESKRPIVIAGPCSAETEEQVMDTAKQLAKNGIKIFSIWHVVLIQIFFRSKDKGLADNLCVQSREEAMKTATTLGADEYKTKGENQ